MNESFKCNRKPLLFGKPCCRSGRRKEWLSGRQRTKGARSLVRVLFAVVVVAAATAASRVIDGYRGLISRLTDKGNAKQWSRPGKITTGGPAQPQHRTYNQKADGQSDLLAFGQNPKVYKAQ